MKIDHFLSKVGGQYIWPRDQEQLPPIMVSETDIIDIKYCYKKISSDLPLLKNPNNIDLWNKCIPHAEYLLIVPVSGDAFNSLDFTRAIRI